MKFLIRSNADAPDIKESMFEWEHHGFAEGNDWKWLPKSKPEECQKKV